MIKTLSVGCDDLPKELTGRVWSAVADLLSCRVQHDSEDDMSGQAMVSQASPDTLVSGDGNDSTDSLVVLRVTNVHVDAVVLSKDIHMMIIDNNIYKVILPYYHLMAEYVIQAPSDVNRRRRGRRCITARGRWSGCTTR